MLQHLAETGPDEVARSWEAATHQVARDSFTFLLDPYESRPTPADWLPRLIPEDQWRVIARGVEQRLRAMNHLLLDVYCGQQQIVPSDVVFSSHHYRPDYAGHRPTHGLFVHIYGIDLVHMGNGRYVVLEDNLRIPSGITYQAKTTEIAADALPHITDLYDIVPFDLRQTYLDLFSSLTDADDPVCVLLTGSKFGAAFFEHRYLSDLLGIPLVEGSDLYRGADGRIWLRLVDRDTPVDLIYRRVEDLEMFVPGLADAYRDGQVVLVNAMGTGAVDDKLVFTWIPDVIRAYLGETPILE